MATSVKHRILFGFNSTISIDGTDVNSFRLLTEGGDYLMTEGGDFINIENNN